MTRPWMFVAVLGLAACETSSGRSSASQSVQGSSASAAPAAPASSLVDLSASTDALRGVFNANVDKPRFLTLLSPTCPPCVRGGIAVERSVLTDARTAGLKSWVVWSPLIDSDERADADALATSITKGASGPQYWDGSKRVALAVAASLGIPEPVVDLYLFYPPGVRWTDAGPPPPEKLLSQTMSTVLGSKGTLPPAADQSQLPPELADRAVVVGEQAQFAELLSEVATSFTRQYAKQADLAR